MLDGGLYLVFVLFWFKSSFFLIYLFCSLVCEFIGKFKKVLALSLLFAHLQNNYYPTGFIYTIYLNEVRKYTPNGFPWNYDIFGKKKHIRWEKLFVTIRRTEKRNHLSKNSALFLMIRQFWDVHNVQSKCLYVFFFF